MLLQSAAPIAGAPDGIAKALNPPRLSVGSIEHDLVGKPPAADSPLAARRVAVSGASATT